MKRIFVTLIPIVSAAIGCSPTERRRSPNGVLKMTNQTTNAKAIAMNDVYWTLIKNIFNTGISDKKGTFSFAIRYSIKSVCPLLYRTRTTKMARPIASMLIATPRTVWSARQRMAGTAKKRENNAPTTMATSKAIHGLEAPTPKSVKVSVVMIPVAAPMTMIPSRAMLTTPERSLKIPPSAAIMSGVA